MALASLVSKQTSDHAYLRAPIPLRFPVEADVPETQRHFHLRTALYLSLRFELGQRATVTSDQFLYWDPTDPSQCLAPDIAVRVAGASAPLDVWKVWLLGAPDVAVEIVSEHDRAERKLQAKLERYRRAGVAEVVRFDPEVPDAPLRLFDSHEGDLVERDLAAPEAFRCDALGLYWVVQPDAEIGLVLRLARDSQGQELVFTPEEAERAAKEAERAAKEAERAAKEAERAAKDAERDAKEAALARVRELEAELRAIRRG
jgi:Uma2 family endonuclease